jgi:hypothetical protein
MTNNREETHRSLIQLVARKMGNHHKPSDYIQRIKDEYDIEVSNSSVTKAIGSLWSRLRSDEPELVVLGQKLLHACHHDKALAGYIVTKVAFVKC